MSRPVGWAGRLSAASTITAASTRCQRADASLARASRVLTRHFFSRRRNSGVRIPPRGVPSRAKSSNPISNRRPPDEIDLEALLGLAFLGNQNAVFCLISLGPDILVGDERRAFFLEAVSVPLRV